MDTRGTSVNVEVECTEVECRVGGDSTVAWIPERIPT